MSKIKVYIAVLFATVCIVSTPTSALANSYQENFIDSQTTGNPIFEILTLLEAFCKGDDCGSWKSKSGSFQAALEPKCYGLQDGAKCWKELANKPGCFVWDEHLNVAQTLTWSGACSNGVGSGDGTLVWTDSRFSFEQIGTMMNGKIDGYWTYRDSDGAVAEGQYIDGKQHGHWIVRYADDTVAEGPYVDGRRHGHWIFRYADGTVAEGPYLNGKRIGHWSFQYSNGAVAEGRLHGDKRYGHWTVRFADGRLEWMNVN